MPVTDQAADVNMLWEGHGLAVYCDCIDGYTITLAKRRPNSSMFESLAHSFSALQTGKIKRDPEGWARGRIRHLLKRAQSKIIVQEHILANVRHEAEELAEFAEHFGIRV